jgi:molybdopterin converting factor small subunit
LSVARLLLFGPAREAAGVASLSLPAETVSGVIAAAEERFGDAFARVMASSNVWLNGEAVDRATSVSDDDEVAVIPPVSGG